MAGRLIAQRTHTLYVALAPGAKVCLAAPGQLPSGAVPPRHLPLTPPPPALYAGPGGSPMPRGGKRPGAGAPRGNMNALKHGERSKQFARIGALIAASPAAREALLILADRHQATQRKADEL